MLDLANIKVFNHIVNATVRYLIHPRKVLLRCALQITVSVLSIGLSCVYAGSRTLLALSEQGYAPGFFNYVDKAGRPLWAVVFVLCWGPIAYVGVVASGPTVFTWLLSVSGLSAIFTWASICLAQ
jgi:amino acid transporter